MYINTVCSNTQGWLTFILKFWLEYVSLLTVFATVVDGKSTANATNVEKI